MKKIIVFVVFFGTMLMLIGVSNVLAAPILGVADYVSIRVAYGDESWGSGNWLEFNSYGTGGDGTSWIYSSNPISYDTGVIQTVGYGDLATGRSVSSADFGLLGVYVSNTGFGSGAHVPVAHANVDATAMWKDTWNIVDPNMTGEGTLNIDFSVDGNQYHDPVPSGYIFWHYGFGINSGHYNGSYGYTSSDWSPEDVTLSVQPVNVTGVFSVPFIFNEPFDITFTLASRDPNAVASSYSGITDFLHTAKLTGMYVSDSAGNAVNNYALETDSGHDYFPSVVPEPSSMLLLGIGGLAMTLLKRRKKII